MDTDIRCCGSEVYFLPVQTRLPLKFGLETVTHVACARVKMIVEDGSGRRAEGWGETPLSASWAWPASLSYEERDTAMKDLCVALAAAWSAHSPAGHPMEIGHDFTEEVLAEVLAEANAARPASEPIPWLAALICSSAFDIAVHDAYGNLHTCPTYATYTGEYMNRDLAAYITPAHGSTMGFEGRYPADFLVEPPQKLPAWHLVGGKDLLDAEELTGGEPEDGYPVLLGDWIDRDGLQCLKVKLRGNDAAWDYERLVHVGSLALEHGAMWLTSDFNCTVEDPEYVIDILDRLAVEHPRMWQMILYVEQPFPYDLEENRIDVHSVSARKPLFMDESAHDWKLVRLGRTLGWTGVALKTCKTQTGALLSLCWAKAHGMTLMVQDLTNPMLAQIPHVLLAAYAGTIMGVETNAMQFYPEASLCEADTHPGLYRRTGGTVDLSSIHGSGFGYRADEMSRTLPEPAATAGAVIGG